jgi:hypothetical protein
MSMVQHVSAPNDRNGNPRRLYLVGSDGKWFSFDEGYLGVHAIPSKYRENMTWFPEVTVSASEYKRLLRVHR